MVQTTLDTFEDGDVAEWSVSGTGQFIADTTDAISGTYSGRAATDAGETVTASRTIDAVVNQLDWNTYVTTAGDPTESTVSLRRSSDDAAIFTLSLRRDSNGKYVWVNGTQTSTTWEYAYAGVNAVSVSLDWSTETIDVSWNGTTIVSGDPFLNSASKVSEFRIDNTEDIEAVIDDIVYDAALKAPSISVTGHSDTSVSLSWSDVSGEDGYRVYRSQDGSSYSQVADLAAGSTSYQDTGLENGEKYWYYVASYAGTESSASNEVSQITDLPGPSSVSLDTSTEDEIGVSWTNNDNSSDGTIEVYRSTDGSLGSQVFSTTTVSTTTYTDTGLADGERYHYTVRRSTDHAESDSGQVAGTTVLPAPTALSVDAINGDQFNLSWTENADNEDGYRVLLSRDGGSSYSQDGGDLPADTATHTTTNLLDGEQYTIKIRVFTEHTTSDSTTVTATTVLPDASWGTLDASVEDELTANWQDTIDYGDYRLAYRETGTSTWTSIGSFGQGTTSHTITGLQDGEKYDVRVRTETEHVTGNWVVLAEVTKLPVPTGLTVSNVQQTSADFAWTDNADNEDGFELYKRRQYADGFGPAEQTASVGADTTTATDDTVTPGTTYEHFVRVYTEHVQADSAAVETTTPSLGLPTTRTGSGWYVEVDHADGTTRTPTIIDDPQRDQQLNGLPSVRIPVPRDETWQADAFTDAPMRVWKDGIRQPIEELRRAEVTPEQTVLVGVGGIQLERKVTDEIDSKPVDDVVRDMVSTVTGYTTNVDDPASSTQADQLQQSSSLSGLRGLIQDTYQQATDPVEVTSTHAKILQTCHLGYDSYYYNGGGFEGFYDSVRQEPSNNIFYIANYAAKVTGNYVEYFWSPEYEVPASRVAFAHHIESFSSESGTAPGPPTAYFVDADGTKIQLSDQLGDGWTHYTSPSVGSLSPDETYGLRIEVPSEFTYYIDAMAQYDTAYTPSVFDEPSGEFDTIAGPELYPGSYVLQTIDSTPPLSVTGGRFTGTFDSVAGSQQIELSNDQGGSWPISVSNADSVEGDFPSLGPAIRARITLSNYGDSGDESAPPRYGYLGQTLDAYDLYADLDDTALVIDQAPETRLLDVLKSYASYADSLFELRWDGANDTLSFEWSQPGARGTVDVDGTADYESAKTTENRPDQIRVQGSAIQVTDESVTAQHGTAVGLDKNNLVTASDEVVDPSSGTVYTRGADYTIGWNDGTITALSGGSISDGQTIEVSYRWQPDDYATINSTSDPTVRQVDIKGLVTKRGCGIAARRIKQQLQEPLYEVSVTLPEAGADWSLLDEIDPSAVPGDPPYKFRSLEDPPQGTSMLLGNRERLGEIIDDVRTRIEQVSQRT